MYDINRVNKERYFSFSQHVFFIKGLFRNTNFDAHSIFFTVSSKKIGDKSFLPVLLLGSKMMMFIGSCDREAQASFCGFVVIEKK